MIHWEVCHTFKLDYTNKLYMHKLESVMENETHKVPWDFEVETDHLISTGRLDLAIVYEKRESAE